MDQEKTLAEQQIESQQRAYELGLRYGHLNARAGRPDMPTTSRQMALRGREAELYDKGWREAYDAYVTSLETAGNHLSVPSLVPGEMIAVTTTGRTRTDAAGVMFVQAITPGGSAAAWYPVHSVRVIR